MAELPFPRTASGLTRRGSLFDVFGAGFMSIGLAAAIVDFLGYGLAVYPGANLWIVAAITLLVGCSVYPVLYGVLAGAMPRAGGQYVYNSRILHPAVAMAESFATVFSWLFWTMILAPQVATLGLSRLAAFHGWTGMESFLASHWGLFAVATAVNVVSVLAVAFGVRVYARLQKVVLVLGVGATAVVCAALSLTDTTAFARSWDAMAGRYDSLTFSEFLPAATDAAGGPFPITWNWTDTLGCLVIGSWLIVYSYMGIYLAGEAKRPRRTIGWAVLLAVVVTMGFAFWAVQGLYHAVPFDYAAAFGWADNAGTDLIAGYNLPFSTDWVSLAYIARPNELVAWAGPIASIAFGLWYVVLMYLVLPRIWFAWGMDRLGPRWFTDISPRWASPVKNYLLAFAISEAMIAAYVVAIVRGDYSFESMMATGLDVVFAGTITAFAALVFPWSRRAREIWATAPLADRKLLGVPVVSVSAAVGLIYTGVIAWFLFVRPEMRDLSWASGLLFAGVLAGGVCWYAFWHYRYRERGIDMHAAHRDLPPE